MKGTWCNFDSDNSEIWYSYQHADILITLSKLLEWGNGILVEIGYPNLIISTWISESLEWINTYKIDNYLTT